MVTTGAEEAAGVFLRERNIKLGVGSPENHSSLVTSGKVHLWTSVSAPYFPDLTFSSNVNLAHEVDLLCKVKLIKGWFPFPIQLT